MLIRQMAMMFCLMLIGYGARKRNKLSQETCSQMSWIVINIANPALILNSGMDPGTDMAGKELLTVVGISAVMYLFLILCGVLLPRVLRIPAAERGIYNVMTVFSNVGFMGIPVVSAVFGSKGVLYTSFFNIFYSILLYTYGVRCFEGSRGKDGWKESVFNIGVISSILGLLIYLLRVPCGSLLPEFTAMLGSLTAPLSMLIVGAFIADVRFGEILRDRKVIIYLVFRMFLIPVIGSAFTVLLIEEKLMRGVCIIMLSVPVGSMVAMFARQYHKYYEETAAIVGITSMISLVSIPLMLNLFLG